MAEHTPPYPVPSNRVANPDHWETKALVNIPPRFTVATYHFSARLCAYPLGPWYSSLPSATVAEGLLPAATRRQNAAHGASRGCRSRKWASPEGAKEKERKSHDTLLWRPSRLSAIISGYRQEWDGGMTACPTAPPRSGICWEAMPAKKHLNFNRHSWQILKSHRST